MKVIQIDKDGCIDLDEFKRYVDITRVVYYKVWTRKDGSLRIRFYDKNHKWIRSS